MGDGSMAKVRGWIKDAHSLQREEGTDPAAYLRDVLARDIEAEARAQAKGSRARAKVAREATRRLADDATDKATRSRGGESSLVEDSFCGSGAFTGAPGDVRTYINGEAKAKHLSSIAQAKEAEAASLNLKMGVPEAWAVEGTAAPAPGACLSLSSSGPRGLAPTYQPTYHELLYREGMVGLAEREKWRGEAIDVLNAKELTDCTFHPQINETSKSLVAEARGGRTDARIDLRAQEVLAEQRMRRRLLVEHVEEQRRASVLSISMRSAAREGHRQGSRQVSGIHSAGGGGGGDGGDDGDGDGSSTATGAGRARLFAENVELREAERRARMQQVRSNVNYQSSRQAGETFAPTTNEHSRMLVARAKAQAAAREAAADAEKEAAALESARAGGLPHSPAAGAAGEGEPSPPSGQGAPKVLTSAEAARCSGIRLFSGGAQRDANHKAAVRRADEEARQAAVSRKISNKSEALALERRRRQLEHVFASLSPIGMPPRALTREQLHVALARLGLLQGTSRAAAGVAASRPSNAAAAAAAARQAVAGKQAAARAAREGAAAAARESEAASGAMEGAAVEGAAVEDDEDRRLVDCLWTALAELMESPATGAPTAAVRPAVLTELLLRSEWAVARAASSRNDGSPVTSSRDLQLRQLSSQSIGHVRPSALSAAASHHGEAELTFAPQRVTAGRESNQGSPPRRSSPQRSGSPTRGSPTRGSPARPGTVFDHLYLLADEWRRDKERRRAESAASKLADCTFEPDLRASASTHRSAAAPHSPPPPPTPSAPMETAPKEGAGSPLLAYGMTCLTAARSNYWNLM